MASLYFVDLRGTLKMVRETLCVAMTAIGQSSVADQIHVERLQRMIDEIDRQRPLGPNGTHGNRHTLTCGCEDKNAF